MIELPDRIDGARALSQQIEIEAPGFQRYTEAAIKRLRNGLPLPANITESAYADTQGARNIDAVLRGEMRITREGERLHVAFN